MLCPTLPPFVYSRKLSTGILQLIAVRFQWERRTAKTFSDFVSKLKANMVQPDTIPNNVWEIWLRLWKDPKCVENSEINAKNRCGVSEITNGTHTWLYQCWGASEESFKYI